MAAVALVLLAACSSAQAADRVVPAPATGPDLPGSATLAAAAADRAESLCEAGDAGTRSDLGAVAEAYDQETWAEVTELTGRARLAEGTDPDEAREAALAEVRSGWQGEDALDRTDWDRAEVATADCSDGTLAAVQVLARVSTSADAGAYRRVRLAEGAIEHREAVRYGTATDVAGEQVDLLLDLFLPPGTAADETAGRPTLVIVHGGGFTAGSRAQHAEDAIAYARRGFVVATIDYRVDPDAGASTEAHRAASFAAIDDGMEAVRWLRAHADELGIDPDRIAALGASAGGEIALGLALLEDLTPGGAYAAVSPQVTAAFSTGAYLTPILGASSLEATDAPVLVHFFETDTESGRSWTYAEATCDAVRSAGGTCDLDVSEGSGHTVGLGPDSSEVDEVMAFLAVHLGLDD